jgi:hypothetical protein
MLPRPASFAGCARYRHDVRKVGREGILQPHFVDIQFWLFDMRLDDLLVRPRQFILFDFSMQSSEMSKPAVTLQQANAQLKLAGDQFSRTYIGDALACANVPIFCWRAESANSPLALPLAPDVDRSSGNCSSRVLHSLSPAGPFRLTCEHQVR